MLVLIQCENNVGGKASSCKGDLIKAGSLTDEKE